MNSNILKKVRPIPLEEFEKRFDDRQLGKIDAYQKYFEALMRVRDVRKELGLSQRELAARSGVPQETISRIESGKRNVNIQTLISLASAMGKKVRVELI